MADDKEITIYDIAKHLNISATTVSRGLKDHPAINKNTRKKIFEAAKHLGYRSNTFASSLRSKKTYTIGVIVPRLNSYFMSSVLAGMEDAANRENYNLIISQSLENSEKEMANAYTMFNKRVDGLLVSLAYDVTKHLIDQGCKRIMHLGGNTLRNVYADRLKGYNHALRDNNLPFDEKKLVYVSKLSEEAGSKAAEQILGMSSKPDAVFSANDTAAVFCMIKLKEAGISIPHDIAFAGFNNDPISKIVEPKLTTVNYSGYDMGEATVNSLVNHLNGISNVKTTNMIILRSDIIVRESSLKNKSL
jgi:LacI family transcriptional regulator